MRPPVAVLAHALYVQQMLHITVPCRRRTQHLRGTSTVGRASPFQTDSLVTNYMKSDYFEFEAASYYELNRERERGVRTPASGTYSIFICHWEQVFTEKQIYTKVHKKVSFRLRPSPTNKVLTKILFPVKVSDKTLRTKQQLPEVDVRRARRTACGWGQRAAPHPGTEPRQRRACADRCAPPGAARGPTGCTTSPILIFYSRDILF